jgi:uncharacterized protein YjiS (DUF1127 family)
MCRYPRLVKDSSQGHITMSTSRAATEPGPAATRRQVYSPLEKYWIAFLEWRKRERVRTELCHLTERELADIGVTRGELDYIASKRGIGPLQTDAQRDFPGQDARY